MTARASLQRHPEDTLPRATVPITSACACCSALQSNGVPRQCQQLHGESVNPGPCPPGAAQLGFQVTVSVAGLQEGALAGHHLLLCTQRLSERGGCSPCQVTRCRLRCRGSVWLARPLSSPGVNGRASPASAAWCTGNAGQHHACLCCRRSSCLQGLEGCSCA